MRKFYPFLFLLTISSAQAQDSAYKNRIANFIRVWGFLKYYHPAVTSGKLDWDKEFMQGFYEVQTRTSKEEFNQFLLQRIDDLGKVAVCKSCKEPSDSLLGVNLDFKWMNDNMAFTSATTEKLHFIRQNRNQKKSYYAPIKTTALVLRWNAPSYDIEKSYPDSVFPSLSMRMLTLARYWNIVNYFYPYKYALDEDWDKVLEEMVSRFLTAGDVLSYHLSILKLTTKIDDSHSGFSSPEILRFFGIRTLPVRIKVVENKPIVLYSYFQDSANPSSVLKTGDIIVKLNNVPIEKIIAEKLRWMQGSNLNSKLRNLAGYLLRDSAKTVAVTYDRGGAIQTEYFLTYTFDELVANRPKLSSPVTLPKPWRILNGNIGYINLLRLNASDVDEAMRELSATTGLILDVRNYPKALYRRFAKYLHTEKLAFAKFRTPDLSYPGLLKHGHTEYVGQSSPLAYKQKVVILVNEETQSQAEFTVMALQKGANVVTIGSQTAGADGDTRKIPLPGGFFASMTGLGVYYPDGGETQRVGVARDIKVDVTLDGIRSNRDELLLAAVTYLNNVVDAKK